jgi:hypothetical protein
MTDRELLEAAAKAAGYEVKETQIGLEIKTGQNCFQYWNPLVDDADAFRLQVDSGVDIRVKNSSKKEELLHVYNNDKYSAARRALVNAVVRTYGAGE